MVTIAFKVFYDGTLFNGFTGNVNSVEYYLRRALRYFLGDDYKLSKASRTDPGVSAFGNVISITTNKDSNLMPSMINSRLPVGIKVWAYARVHENFSARRARARTYVYIMPWHGEDLSTMSKGAELLIGVHDLVNFQVKEKGVPTVVNIMDLSVIRRGDLVIFKITGKGFRNKMIRKIINALSMLGNGSLTMEELRDLINNIIMRPIPPAPPYGLFLLSVDYGSGEPNWVIDLGSIIDIINFIRNRSLYFLMNLNISLALYREFMGLISIPI